VVIAEGLVRLGLGTSKHGDYAVPLPKRYTGTLAHFAPGSVGSHLPGSDIRPG